VQVGRRFLVLIRTVQCSAVHDSSSSRQCMCRLVLCVCMCVATTMAAGQAAQHKTLTAEGYIEHNSNTA
jgi:hypothetical protein